MRQEVYLEMAELKWGNQGLAPPPPLEPKDGKGPGATTPPGRMVGMVTSTKSGREEDCRGYPVSPSQLAVAGMGRAFVPGDTDNNRLQLFRRVSVSHRSKTHGAVPPLRRTRGLDATQECSA